MIPENKLFAESPASKRTSCVAWITSSLALVVSFVASADTVAWWHFDECEPGTTAPANTLASDQAPSTYAHVYTVGDSGAMSALHENSGDYLPTYTRPFRGLAVYDPVTDTTHTNHAAMKFRIDRGGANPNTNGGRAWYGGALKFDGGYDLYTSLYGTTAFTVEAFVCTTGGVYNLFAPIVGSVNGSYFQKEPWALYMRDDGTIAVRFAAGEGDPSAWYTSSGLGKAKVNDGVWHHVAFTYDGSYVRIYVDYALDKKSTDSSDRVYTKTGNIPTYSADNATWVGGYAWGNANDGGRKFPGVIDEIRVSNATLQPEQFLRMQRLDADDADVVRVSFESDEYGFKQNDYMNIADNLGANRKQAVFRRVSGTDPSSYDTETKAGDVMASGMYSDMRPENVAAYYQTTNAAGKANYIQVPSVSRLISGSDGAAASYTAEMFYKTRKTVRGTESDRQVLMKFGGTPHFNVLFNALNSGLLYAWTIDGKQVYHSASAGADDGKWHHVACVVDGTAQKISFYFDYQLVIARTGTLPDIGASSSSMFFGASHQGDKQFFDGWMDDIRVTRRALTPNEFLTTHPVGSGDGSMVALFEQNYDFTSPENADLSVTGIGEARTGGNAPTFVNESRGKLVLDGKDGSQVVANDYSVSLNASRVVAPDIPFFEADSYTVEFLAKLDGAVDANGALDPASTNLANHVPIVRLSRMDSTDYDWYIYRAKDKARAIMMAIGGQYPGWSDSSNNLTIDGRWHHYAFTFEPVNDGTNTLVKFFYDYKNVRYGSQSKPGVTLGFRLPKRVSGHRLMIGEGSNTHPNLVAKFDAVRVSKGVLDPSQFLGRVHPGCMILIR